MAYDEAKFTELLLYVARQLEDDPAGGATKLNKVLFFSEFAYFRAHGEPITGAEYQKLPQGPAPRRLLPVRTQLEQTGQARLDPEPRSTCLQQRLVPLRDPDLSVFTPEELATVDRVVAELHGRSATDTSYLSHKAIGWQVVAEGETIPYETAFLRKPTITDAVRQRIRLLAAEHSL